LNPLAVTLSLLFWAWIWGAMGLILAVPLAGATKIVCDYVDPLRGFGAWLGVFRVSFKEKSLALQFDLPCTPT
jgi:predicted PurR-regulated permease PerM